MSHSFIWSKEKRATTELSILGLFISSDPSILYSFVLLDDGNDDDDDDVEP